MDDGTATLHFQKLDGSEYTPLNVQLDSIGHFEVTYTVESDKPFGTYHWWGIDNATGKISNTVTYIIKQ